MDLDSQNQQIEKRCCQIYTIGEYISGKISEITDLDNDYRIIVDINNKSWKCTLQWNSALGSTIKLLRIGDDIDGWVIRKNIETNSISIGQSFFGLYPPKPDVLIRYFDALLYFKRILSEYFESSKIELKREYLSEIKGLVNRCIRKDQWDWLIIYQAFGFSDDSEVLPLSRSIEKISEAFRLLNKQKIDENGFSRSREEFFNSLNKYSFISRVKNAIVYLNDESRNWEIMRVSLPVKSELTNEKSLIGKTKEFNSYIRINSHIRHGVSMSESQRTKIRDILHNVDIKLSDGTHLTDMNFDDFDWLTQTIVVDYEKEISRDNLDNNPKILHVSDSIDTNIKKERANIVHSQLVSTMAQKVSNSGLTPLSNGLLDLFTHSNGRYLLFEMKSIHKKNEVSQIRKAISQLYEYRYLHSLPNAELCIVLSEKPSEDWLIEYILNDRNILVCWLVKGGFSCPSSIKNQLWGFATSLD